MMVIDAARTRAFLPFKELIEALRNMFVAGCNVPLRHSHTIEGDRGSVGTLLLMPAWSANGYMGVKTVCIYPGNPAIGLPGLHSTYVLYEAATGAPLAQIDGNEITSRRTAAASALAASYLARADAQTLTIIGAGRVASLLAEAFHTVRSVGHVRVWDINVSLARTLVDRLNAAGMEAELASDREDAVRTADIVSCATLSTQPLVYGSWLTPGAHLDLIGAFTPDMRESDDECFRHSSIFVDTDEAATKAGDLLSPMKNGVFRREDIKARLADLCDGSHSGRKHDREITVFKAVGTGLEDLAAASLVYERARKSAVIQANRANDRVTIPAPGRPAF